LRRVSNNYWIAFQNNSLLNNIPLTLPIDEMRYRNNMSCQVTVRRHNFSWWLRTHMLKADLADLELLGLLPLLECLPPNIMSANGSCPPKNSANMSSADRKWNPPKSPKWSPEPPERNILVQFIVTWVTSCKIKNCI
jgi:hypothetical protein